MDDCFITICKYTLTSIQGYWSISGINRKLNKLAKKTLLDINDDNIVGNDPKYRLTLLCFRFPDIISTAAKRRLLLSNKYFPRFILPKKLLRRI